MKRTATVEYFDEDYGFYARLQITGKVDEDGSLLSPIEIDCKLASVRIAHGDEILCKPNEDETTRDFGMRLWHSMTKGARETYGEKFAQAVRDEDAARSLEHSLGETSRTILSLT